MGRYICAVFIASLPLACLAYHCYVTCIACDRDGEKLIKLNSELIKYSINEIDYVIVHELSHFIEFNHSKNFWKYVKKYYPNYKEAQKVLKEE